MSDLKELQKTFPELNQNQLRMLQRLLEEKYQEGLADSQGENTRTALNNQADNLSEEA